MPSLSQARNLYQRAIESGDFSKLGPYMVELLQPVAPRVYKGKQRGKEVAPPPIMQTVFADGRICRMTICQLEGQPLPVEKATRIAQGIYADHVCGDVPDVISCARVNGQPRPENCGLVSYPLTIQSRVTIGQISAETAEQLRRVAA